MQHIIRLFLTLSIYLSISFSTFAKDSNNENAKAVLLYYISGLVDWPVIDSVKSFNIGILGEEPEFTKELEKIASTKTIQDKPIVIKAINEFEDPDNVQVMFVNKSYHDDIAEILGYCQKYRILQVTDHLENKRYTVVNFVEDIEDGEVAFEVNKSNLDATNLRYKDDLLVYGGNLNDLRELYHSTKNLLEKEVMKVFELNEDIIRKNKELNLKTASIDSLTQQIFYRKDTLTKLLTTIESQTSSLEEQRATFERTRFELERIRKLQTKQLAAIKEKETKLVSLDVEIHNREAVIKQQSNEMLIKDSTIQTKSRMVLILTFLGSTIFLLGLLIYRAYFMKRKNNRILEEMVTKRSSKLIEINQDLQFEISRRQKFENELVKSERNYREIFNATSDAICIYNMEGKIIDVNNAMLKMYGYDKNEVNKLTFSDLCSKKDNYSQEIAMSYIGKAISTGKIVFDWQAKRSNGEVLWVEVALSKTNIADSECLLSVIRDIDEKKKNAMELETYRMQLEQMVDNRTIELKEANIELNSTNTKLASLNKDLESQKQELELTLDQLQKAQNQLIESEKMAAIGIIAAGIAHEINNPLNYIKGGVFGIKSVLEKKYEIGDEISELIMGVDLGVDKASKIISSLNHFNRQSEVLDEKCEIHTIIENCLAILNYQIKNRIEIDKDYSKKPLICLGNEGKMHQVILNVLTNAAQSIKNKGNIWITTGILENKKLFIQVKDSGTGIKPENIVKVTTPFFTTKEPGKGTGLGLSISNKIINDHKGELIIRSEENKGTSVIIYLPLN